MIKKIIIISKAAGMDGDTFRSNYIDHHGPIVAAMPGLKKYIQNPTFPGPDGKELEISGIAEIWYENEDAFHFAMASEQAKLANESLAKFTDTSKTKVYTVQEYVII